MKIQAAVLRKLNVPMEIEELELGPVLAEDVLVKVAACGVCHSDLNAVKGFVQRPLPLVMGHEGAGVVVEVGKNVTSVKPGDHVVMSFQPYCGQCPHCREGHTYRCANRRNANGVMWDGTPRLRKNGEVVYQLAPVTAFATYSILHYSAAVPIPKDVPLDRACLVGCAISTGMGAALHNARVRAGSTALVIGCGGIGLSIVQGCRISGASRIIVADLFDKKLEEAKRFGATDGVNAKKGKIVDQVMQLTEGRGVDYAFEAVGNTQCMMDCFESLSRGGLAVLVGLEPDPKSTLPISPGKLRMERSITGSGGGLTVPWRDFPLYIDYYKQGRLLLDEMVTSYGRLADVNRAMEALDRGETLRTVLRMG